MVFDITSRESFESTEKWIADVRAQRGNDVVIVLVGNKTDLAAQRAVTTAELEARAAINRERFEVRLGVHRKARARRNRGGEGWRVVRVGWRRARACVMALVQKLQPRKA